MDDGNPEEGVPAADRHEAVPKHPPQVAAEVLEPDDAVEQQSVDDVDAERGADDQHLGGVQDVKAAEPFCCVVHDDTQQYFVFESVQLYQLFNASFLAR